MASLITVNDGTSTTTSPVLVLGYQTSRESQNVVHDLIGGGIAVTLVRPRPRAGTLELFYVTEAAAHAAAELHAGETSFTFTDTERTTVAMTYVVDGSVGVELDDESREYWTVSVDYQEVEA